MTIYGEFQSLFSALLEYEAKFFLWFTYGLYGFCMVYVKFVNVLYVLVPNVSREVYKKYRNFIYQNAFICKM